MNNTNTQFLVRLANTRAHGWKYKLKMIGLPGSGSRQSMIKCFYKHEHGDGYDYTIFQAVAAMVSGAALTAENALASLDLRPRSLQELNKAIEQRPGYNKSLRRKLLIACGLPPAQA